MKTKEFIAGLFGGILVGGIVGVIAIRSCGLHQNFEVVSGGQGPSIKINKRTGEAWYLDLRDSEWKKTKQQP